MKKTRLLAENLLFFSFSLELKSVKSAKNERKKERKKERKNERKREKERRGSVKLDFIVFNYLGKTKGFFH